jgi:subtilisin family serine protease
VRVYVSIGAAVLLASAGLAVGVPASEAQAPETGDAGAQLIVRFEPDATKREQTDAREEADTDFQRRLPVEDMQLLAVEPGQTAKEAERALEQHEAVLYAEPNALRRISLRPNDPYFDVLWGMENRGQAIRGAAGTADADSDVSEVWDANIGGTTIVAVIDSGVDTTHPDLAANIWRNPGESGQGRESNGLDDDRNGRRDDWRGWDFVTSDNDPADENGHGTHVAGTIAGVRNNGIGVAGVAGSARILPVRTLDANGSGRVSDVILAYAYAAQLGAKVVNLSLGATTASRAERDAIAAYPTMLFVAAAGNGGSDGVGDDNDVLPTYPCAYELPNVLCVAASDNRDALAGFSNYGRTSVDLAAPGVAIASTWPGGGYSWSSGTSMATPHVSGAAALLWAANGNATVLDIDSAVRAGVDASQAFANRTVTGGRLNVLRSLRLVSDVSIGTPAPAPSPSGSSGSAPSGGRGTGGSAGIGDAVAPRLSVRIVRGQSLSQVLRRGLRVRVRCSEACTTRLALRLRRRTLTVPKRTALRRAGSKRVTVRFSKAGLRTLRRRGNATLRLAVSATDRAGNRRRLAVAVRVRR